MCSQDGPPPTQPCCQGPVFSIWVSPSPSTDDGRKWTTQVWKSTLETSALLLVFLHLMSYQSYQPFMSARNQKLFKNSSYTLVLFNFSFAKLSVFMAQVEYLDQTVDCTNLRSQPTFKIVISTGTYTLSNWQISNFLNTVYLDVGTCLWWFK